MSFWTIHDQGEIMVQVPVSTQDPARPIPPLPQTFDMICMCCGRVGASFEKGERTFVSNPAPVIRGRSAYCSTCGGRLLKQEQEALLNGSKLIDIIATSNYRVRRASVTPES